jgi:hypothetical protein
MQLCSQHHNLLGNEISPKSEDFCTLVTMATAAILNLSNPNSCHTLRLIFLQSCMRAKFGFQVDYDVANWYPSLVCYGGHFESKMAAKIQKSSDLGEICFPNRLWQCHHNLLGSQILLKSEDFVFGDHFAPWLPCQRPPFWFFFNLPPLPKLPDTKVDIPTNFLWSLMKTAKMLKKTHKKDHSRLLAEQKLMKLDRNNIHI